MTIKPGIEVVHTPAHTPGGLSVVVATEQGQAVITDFCVIEENYNPPPAVRAMEMKFAFAWFHPGGEAMTVNGCGFRCSTPP